MTAAWDDFYDADAIAEIDAREEAERQQESALEPIMQEAGMEKLTNA